MAAPIFTAEQVREQIFFSQSKDNSEPEEESEDDVSSEEGGEAETEEEEEERDEGQEDSQGWDLRLDTSEEEVDDEEVVDEEVDDDDDDDEEIVEEVQREEQIEQDEDDDDDDDDDDTFMSKDGKIKWSLTAFHNNEGARKAPAALPSPPAQGPTEYAAGQAVDLESTFRMFVTPAVERIVLENTNLEGSRKLGDAWKGMDEVDLRAYLGLLILAGVYRSRGEAVASLWDAESGRAIFRATMPLKVFHAYSKLLRFDDRQTRPARRAADKLAAVREVWDAWVERLPSLYDPGPSVTVDEQLVPFRGRCPFRQYMPSKPAKYGIKFWVACDAKSSYAWKMQIYTGKPGEAGGGGKRGSEKKQGERVVLDVTEGLAGPRNVTCDNFFTSYELGQRLLGRELTMLGTVRKNKPELPPALLSVKGRSAFSSVFAFTPSTALVSYVPKKNKNVLLMSTLHAAAAASDEVLLVDAGRRDKKPFAVLDYNATKGGVDNLDKVIGTYSCRRKTERWPVAVFHNVLDVSCYNAFVVWREAHPDWMPGNRSKRRVFLEQLGKALVTPLIRRRRHPPRSEASASLVRTVQKGARDRAVPPLALHPAPDSEQQQRQQRCVLTADLVWGDGGDEEEEDEEDDNAFASAASSQAKKGKRKRCQFCPRVRDRKTSNVCHRCERYICHRHLLVCCQDCAPCSG